MAFILVIHVIACVLLGIAILVQAGRGGGLTETFRSAESTFGTQTNVFMVRLTTILAIIFLCTSLTLAFNSAKKEKSLMADKKLLSNVPKTVPAPKEEDAVQIKIETPKPLTAEETGLPVKQTPASSVTNATK